MDFIHGHILFLDGECMLCQHTSHFIHHLDHNKCIYFSPIQGKTAQILPPEWRSLSGPNGDPSGNVILAEYTKGGQHVYWHGADAMLRVLLLTKGVMSPLWIFYYTPSVLKNLVYRQIAKNRHRLSSKMNNCPIPPQSFQDVLLP